MTLTLGMITIDTSDATPLATWWAEQTGASVVEDNGGFYVVLAGGGLPLMLAFQQVEDPTPGKNLLHLDLMTDDLDGEVDRLLGVGASLVARREQGTFAWATMADPAGNVFCVATHADATAEFAPEGSDAVSTPS